MFAMNKLHKERPEKSKIFLSEILVTFSEEILNCVRSVSSGGVSTLEVMVRWSWCLGCELRV